jgi:hypothetical protein
MDETGVSDVIDLGRASAPWGKELLIQAVRYPSGMRLARLRIREGRRFTVIDLDETTARWLTQALAQALSDDARDQAAT